ncbi:aspartate-semialdehyde dehydrogenase [Haliovirga abyssi]|uniref:Aspartate-semialdehyde dehydrogenase n=1 Tax=Haliovirga abyssi TaxID=2996794 RepID=A0AAU9DCD7_9FUSO|nr:aspartate-semialdehyde dehydrogenase [Haliovirga abyssi]BDU49808.1 aspartate-semialdehyde dehydrogenase [Haliovirga abyssi]
MKSYRVGIVGATGAVGQEMLNVLGNRNFPVKELRLFASARSAGKKIKFKGKDIVVEELTKEFYKGLDIALFSAGGNISKEFAPIAAQNGVVVIDNSSAFRMDDNVPLVVPEVNPEDIKKHKGIIANPNCSTIQMCVALWPIHKEFGIKRLLVSTYQAASGAGAKGMQELLDQTKAFVEGKEIPIDKFVHQLLFNVIPHIDEFTDNGFTKEELKMINETRKIFHDNEIKISATTVRVPVLRAHSESINLELEKKSTSKEIRELLRESEGVKVIDNPKNNEYPMPIDAAGTYATYVGRIRDDEVFENGISLWVVADQILKGAALNAVQIAELL